MESSTAKRKRASRNRNSRAPSTSTSESRNSQKRNRRRKANTAEPGETEDDDYYTARRILKQRFHSGQLEYYVDWEDNPKTGEVYEPTWEPEEYCTSGLIESWQKSQSNSQTQGHSDPVSDISRPSSPPTPPAKRRRVTIQSPFASQEQTVSKKPRTAGTAESARFQSVSQETVGSGALPAEIKDSYEEEDQDSGETRVGVAQVEVGVPQDFDRDAYATYLSSSQPSQHFQPAQVTDSSEQTSSEHRHIEASVNHRPFIWDEDLSETQLPDSSSYNLSTTTGSRVGTTATQQTDTLSTGVLEPAESGSAQGSAAFSGSEATGNIDSQFAEPESHFFDTGYTQDHSLSSSPESYSVEEPSLSSGFLVQSIEDVSEETLEETRTCNVVDSTTPHSSRPGIASEDQDRLTAEHPVESRSQSVASEAARLQASPESQADQFSSSVPFQTQLPADHRGQRSTASLDIPDFSQDAQVVEGITQTLDYGSPSQLSTVLATDTIAGAEVNNLSAQVTSSIQGLPLAATKVSQPDFDSSRIWSDTHSDTAEDPQNRAASHPLAGTQDSLHNFKASIAPFAFETGFLRSQSEIPQRHLFERQRSLPRVRTPARRSSKTPPQGPVTPKNWTSSYCSNVAFEMEKTPPEPSPARYDAKSKIAEMMAAAKAKTAAKQASRSSSTVSPSPAPTPAINRESPSLEASPLLPVDTPEKDLAIAPSPPRLSPGASPEDDEVSPRGLKVVPNGANEFIVPLPMTTYTRDVYYQTIRNYKTQASTFLEDEVFSETLVGEIDSMLSKLVNLCDHQDLDNNDPSTQRLDSAEIQAKWAETVSTKCIFLAEFLLLLQQYDKHVVILVRPGRMLEILESLCIRHNFVYNRADEPGWSVLGAAGLKVTLLPTGGDIYIVDPASVVIAFDSTARSVAYVNDFRTNPISPTVLAPVISLVVTHSVEHLERCFHTDVEHTGRKVKLVSYLYHIADNVGKLDLEDYPDPAGAAKLVAEYVLGSSFTESWPIMAMPDVEGIDLSPDSPQSYERDGQVSVETETFPSAAPQSGIKRQSEEMTISMGSPKRQKLTPIPLEQEDVAYPQSSEAELQSSTEFVAENIQPVLPFEQEAKETPSLLQKIIDLEAQLRTKEAIEADLRRINQDLEYRCQDYESSIQEIQPKYQEALNDRGQFENEAKLALEREVQMKKQRDVKDVELRRLQDRQDFIDSELDAARLALSASTIPQAAELGTAKAEKEVLRAENENLKKRLSNMSKDMDYMRNEYQKASSAASAAAVENRNAQALIAELREKASDNIVRVQEIQRENDGIYLRQRIKELEAEKADVVRANEKLDADLKALSNGRRGTRGTSVPKSPRMGGTMSPGPARPIGRMIQQGSGSRGNSPAPGDFGPNRMGFGEALFQGTPTARWGNHLQ